MLCAPLVPLKLFIGPIHGMKAAWRANVVGIDQESFVVIEG